MRTWFWIAFLGAFLFSNVPRLPAQQTSKEALVQKFLALEIEETNRYQILREFQDIDPKIGLDALSEAWPKLRSDAKLSLMNTFLAAANPYILGVFHLGATDQSLAVQNFALSAVETVSFRTFNDDYNAYLEWYNRNHTKKLESVLTEGVKAFSEEMAKAGEDQREFYMSQLLNKNFVSPTRIASMRRKAVMATTILETAGSWLSADGSPNLTSQIIQFLRIIRPDEQFMRKYALPLASKDNPPNIREQAISLFASPDSKWATDTLLKMFVEEYPEPITSTLGMVLSQIGDPRIIPTMIGMLEADNTREGIMQLGNVLANVTGVLVLDNHDAAWWREWWKRNNMRFPPDVRKMPFPKLVLKKRVPPPGFVDPTQPRAETRLIGNDPQKSYWVVVPPGRYPRNRNNRFVGNEEPRLSLSDGLGVIVVLDENGNGAALVSLWTEILRSLPNANSYCIILPVGPRWNTEQKIAWVTSSTKKLVQGAQFTTESFVREILTDVAKVYTIDPKRVFLHGVGEGGLAAYSCALEPDTPFKGFYILASPFRSAQLPPLKNAKGRRIFIHHSKDDRFAPYLTAAAAQKILGEHGATVKLVTYRGKHGYEFDDNRNKEIGAALGWLETSK